MKIIKTYHKYINYDSPDKRQTGEVRFMIRTDCYGGSLALILRLLEEAKKDFPHLDPEDISCKVYGGRTIAGIMGIEFAFGPIEQGSTKTIAIPDGYEEGIVHLTR